MKRSFAKRLAPALLLAVLAIPTSGRAATVTVERKGSLKVIWNEVLAVTEADWVLSGCEAEPHTIPDGGTQGLDAYIIELPAGSQEQRIEMTELKMVNGTDGTAVVLAIPDIDWYFFDAECALVEPGYTGMATAVPLEKGTVPATAKWAIAYLFAGPPAYFTVEIDTVVPDPE